jgi:hypothetical protein
MFCAARPVPSPHGPCQRRKTAVGGRHGAGEQSRPSCEPDTRGTMWSSLTCLSSIQAPGPPGGPRRARVAWPVCLDKYSLLVSLSDTVWVVPMKSQLTASYRHCSIANYGRWKVTFNLAAPFYRVRSVTSHRLGDILRNGISLRPMAWWASGFPPPSILPGRG